MKLKITALLFLVGSMGLLTGCGGSEIGKTQRTFKEVSGLGNDWKVVCIDGVEYILRSHGLYSTTLVPHLKRDGKPYTCES